MILKKVSIRGFRSIRDTQDLFVDDLVTVLIGANDHGKTNVLHAIQALNEDRPFTAEDQHWDVPDVDVPRATWVFTLSEEEREALREAYKQEKPAGGSAEAAPEPPSPAPDIPDKLTFTRSGVGGALEILDEADVLTDEQVSLALKMRPRVELFDVQQKVADQVQLAQLEQPEFEFMRGIFEKAGIWEDRGTLFSQTPKSARTLDEASARLTEVLRREWEQGKELEWKFVHGGSEGNIIRLMIKDPAVATSYVRPSQRSQGFTSFFILSLTVFARTFGHPEDSFIFLFDEPGTYLHPIAQVNLQRVFESLADRSQIIYATHSIFLVNKNVPSRNRVIRKLEEGTVIDRKPRRMRYISPRHCST